MKKVNLFNSVKKFEMFVNREDIEIISIDIKVVKQNFVYQEGFAAIVFYKLIT